MAQIDFKGATELAGGEQGLTNYVRNAPRDERLLFSRLLFPDRESASYDATMGNMTIRSGAAALLSLNGSEPATDIKEAVREKKPTATIGNKTSFDAEDIRNMEAELNNNPSLVNAEFTKDEIFGLADETLVKPRDNTKEFLNVQAAVMGKIDWKFSGLPLAVDYNLPHILAEDKNTKSWYTGGGFWDAVNKQKEMLQYAVRYRIASLETIKKVIGNATNKIQHDSQPFPEQGYTLFTLRKIGDVVGQVLDEVQIMAYWHSAPILSQDGTSLKQENFMPDNRILAVGSAVNQGYHIGQSRRVDGAVGFHHVGPTEGFRGKGTGVEIAIPRRARFEMIARTNVLPVIESKNALVVARTA